MPIDTRTQKIRIPLPILKASRAEVVNDFALAMLARNVQITRDAKFFRDNGKEVVDCSGADACEHRFALRRRFWKIAHDSVQPLASSGQLKAL
jgi:hypothetical protein